MILGYARVSTDDQNLDAQLDALKAAGAERIFADKISGSSRKRPELGRMLEQLRADDVVVVTKYDRLARSLKDLIDIVQEIRERVLGFGPLLRTSIPPPQLVVWCSMFSDRSQSSSASESQSEHGKGSKRPASAVG